MDHKKLDLDTLEYIKFTCDLYSDSSSVTLGYIYLCKLIEEVKEVKKAKDKSVGICESCGYWLYKDGTCLRPECMNY